MTHGSVGGDGDPHLGELGTQKPGQGSGHYSEPQDYELPAGPTQSVETQAGSEPARCHQIVEKE